MLSRFFKCLKSLPRTVLLVLAMPLVVLCSASSAFAQLRVFVDEDSTATTPTGASWPTAYRYLPQGIARAEELSDDGNVPVEVWVAEGTYRPDESEANPTGTNNRALSFQMHNNVKMYGGFDTNETGTQAEQFLQREPLANFTTHSGAINTGAATDNTYHVVSAIGVGPTAIIDGFVIVDGYAVDAPFPGYPDSSANPDAVPIHAGAGMYIMSRNDGFPGLAGSPTVLRCTFVNNRADLGAGAFVHGAQGGEVYFENCVFRMNVADTDGGGIYNYGMSNVPQVPETTNYSRVVLINCLLHDNTADDGGAFWSDQTTSPDLINCTVAYNTSGIFQQTVSGRGDVTLLNTIVFFNDDTTPNDPQIIGERCLIRSCIEDGPTNGTSACDDHNIAGNPLFADPEGDDEVAGTADDNFRLTGTSPCIDKGDTGPNCGYNWDDAYDLNQNGYTSLEGPPDLDLKTRVIRQIGNAFAQSLDMGAYEFGQGCAGDTNGDNLINIDDILSIVNGWGPCPAAPGTCPGDVTMHVCSAAASTVDIDDMLIVINSWGHNCITDETEDVGSLSSVEDCMDAATNEELEPFSPEWDDFVTKCVDGLCEAEIIECD